MELGAKAGALLEAYVAAMEAKRLRDGLKCTIQLSTLGNQFFQVGRVGAVCVQCYVECFAHQQGRHCLCITLHHYCLHHQWHHHCLHHQWASLLLAHNAY